jgi:hypothetical protein
MRKALIRATRSRNDGTFIFEFQTAPQHPQASTISQPAVKKIISKAKQAQ